MMDKRIAAVALAAAATLLFVACPPESAPAPALPGLSAPAWQDGETAVYHVTRNDTVLFETKLVLRLDEEQVNFAAGPRPVPTAVLTMTVEPMDAPTFFYDSSTVVFRRDSFIPLRSARNLETDLASYFVDASYEPGRIVIRKQSVDGTEEGTRKHQGRVYDKDMVWYLLRAVPPEPSTTFSFEVAIPLDLRIRTTSAQVLGTKLIVTPLDSIICREYELDTGPHQVRLWFEVAQPHRFVGLVDPGNGVEMKLVRYAPGNADTLGLPTP